MKISSASKKVLASALSAAMVVAFAPTVAFGADLGGTDGVAAPSGSTITEEAAIAKGAVAKVSYTSAGKTYDEFFAPDTTLTTPETADDAIDQAFQFAALKGTAAKHAVVSLLANVETNTTAGGYVDLDLNGHTMTTAEYSTGTTAQTNAVVTTGAVYKVEKKTLVIASSSDTAIAKDTMIDDWKVTKSEDTRTASQQYIEWNTGTVISTYTYDGSAYTAGTKRLAVYDPNNAQMYAAVTATSNPATLYYVHSVSAEKTTGTIAAGELTVKDSSEAKTGAIEGANGDAKVPAIVGATRSGSWTSYGTVSIEGGTFDGAVTADLTDVKGGIFHATVTDSANKVKFSGGEVDITADDKTSGEVLGIDAAGVIEAAADLKVTVSAPANDRTKTANGHSVIGVRGTGVTVDDEAVLTISASTLGDNSAATGIWTPDAVSQQKVKAKAAAASIDVTAKAMGAEENAGTVSATGVSADSVTVKNAKVRAEANEDEAEVYGINGGALDISYADVEVAENENHNWALNNVSGAVRAGHVYGEMTEASAGLNITGGSYTMTERQMKAFVNTSDYTLVDDGTAYTSVYLKNIAHTAGDAYAIAAQAIAEDVAYGTAASGVAYAEGYDAAKLQGILNDGNESAGVKLEVKSNKFKTTSKTLTEAQQKLVTAVDAFAEQSGDVATGSIWDWSAALTYKASTAKASDDPVTVATVADLGKAVSGRNQAVNSVDVVTTGLEPDLDAAAIKASNYIFLQVVDGKVTVVEPVVKGNVATLKLNAIAPYTYVRATTGSVQDALAKAQEAIDNANKKTDEVQAALVKAQDKAALATVKGKTVKAKAKKKTTAKLTVVTSESGAVSTFAKTSGNKKITVSKGGKITVKKGLKAGKKYVAKVKATVGAQSKTIKVTVKVAK